jgi:hypothetical protein
VNRCTCLLASASRKPLRERRGPPARRGCHFRAILFAAGALVAALPGSHPGGAAAQVLGACPLRTDKLFQAHRAPTSCPSAADHQVADTEPSLSPGRAFLYSTLVPGLGQQKLGRGRWLAYLAVEGAAWIAFGRARGSATDRRDEYRNLAWDVGRTFGGARVDGDFPYYEAMEKFETSGAFDTDPVTPGVQPQMDPSTFNGRAWSLATDIHFPPGTNPLPGDPEYTNALADYQTRAYDEGFEWSWTGQSAAWSDYMDLIESSDRSFRRASQFLGVVIANHLLSGIDAFLTARVPGSGGDQAEARIRLEPNDDRRGLRLVLRVRH